MPAAITRIVVSVSCQLAQLCKNGKPIGANDVDDERRRQQLFDEPARMEQMLLVFGDFVAVARQDPAIENVQHHEKRRVIEQRAARPDEHDEAGEPAHRPWAWRGDLLRVHVVRRNRHLRKIV